MSTRVVVKIAKKFENFIDFLALFTYDKSAGFVRTIKKEGN